MIELQSDRLVFSFPEVHEHAVMSIDFQRTLRIPDDERDYPLPAGLGCFPVRHVDDFADRVPDDWLRHGGVMLPMYQSEALWLHFGTSWAGCGFGYPFAVKVAAGKINAVTGEPWTNGLGWEPQDYVVVPAQPWLDGYAVEKGVIRQFVAMPLGSGYSAEAQITGREEHGGLQLIVYPMKRESYERVYPPRFIARPRGSMTFGRVAQDASMGLAPGGRMRQEIFDDPFEPGDWDTQHASRCFVHLANSMVWRAITGQEPPTVPPTAKEYTRAGLPWFEYYGADQPALKGSSVLDKLKSVTQLAKQKGDMPLPENEPVTPQKVIQLRAALRKHQVREGEF